MSGQPPADPDERGRETDATARTCRVTTGSRSRGLTRTQSVVPSTGGVTKGLPINSGGQPVIPSREGATQCPSTCTGGQPVASSKGGGTQVPSNCSGDQPFAPSRGGGTQARSTRSRSQPVAPSRVGATQGSSTCSRSQSVVSSRVRGTQVPSICSGGQLVMPLRGEATQGPSTHSESQPMPISNKCRGCDFNKPSLRGHLARTNKLCKKLYTAEELLSLEQQAKVIQKKQTAQWKKSNKEAANEHERWKYHKTPEKEKARKRVEYLKLKKQSDVKKEDLICNICDIKCGSRYALDRHYSEIHNPEPIPCPKCDKAFLRKVNLKDHLDSAHDIKRPEPTLCSVECKPCKKKFSNSSSQLRHYGEAHCEVKFECPDCSKEFTRGENLQRHFAEVHDSVKEFSCSICCLTFARKEKLNRHMSDVHKGTKLFSCNECSKTFSQKENMIRHHADVHKKEKNWECDCPEDFSRYENLQRHKKRGKHTFVIEGGCPHCKEDPSFKSDTAMKAHFIKKKGMSETCVTMRMRMREKDKRMREEIEKRESEVHYCPVCEKHYKGYSSRKHVWKNLYKGKPTCDTLFFPKNKEFGLKRTGVLEFRLTTLLCGCGCRLSVHDPGFHY